MSVKYKRFYLFKKFMTFITYTETEMTKIRIIQKLEDKVITIEQVKEALDVSERTVFRYLKRFRKLWPPGLIHWLKGHPSNNQKGKLEKYKRYAMKQKYKDFGPTLLAEHLEEELWWWRINRESLRLKMITWWLWFPKERNTKVKRQKRERRRKVWILIQFDGSYHDWLEDWKERCLLLAIDDSTSKLMLWIITWWESLKDMVIFWKDYFLKYGKPWAIYVDCHATYKVNHKHDQFDNEMMTRFQRAMRKLCVEVIYSKQPEWKWRVERSFRTHQDRLIKKMRVLWIKTEKEANEYIEKTYIPEHNKKFAVKPQEKWDGHSLFTKYEQERYKRFFAKETERKIRKDGTVRYNKKEYQIKKWERLYDWKKVIVYETTEGCIEIYSWKYKISYVTIRNR